MYKIRIILLLSAFSALEAFSQINTYSPYSRYGIGLIENTSSISGKAMGETGTALRIPNQINYYNPASYTSQDTLSFIFDVGFHARLSTFSTETDQMEKKNMNIEHIEIGFPISNFWKTSIGIRPFSNVGYSIFQDTPLSEYSSSAFTRDQYEGRGGTNIFYFGNAVELFDIVSVGLNVNYLFGRIEHDVERFFYSREDTLIAGSTVDHNRELMDMRGFMFNYGLQVYPSFGKHQITAGFTFESASSFDADYNSIKDQRFGSTQDGRYIFSQTVEETDSIIDITLPSQFSLGLSYMYDQKLLISAEYQTRDWSNYKILQESNEFKQSHSMGFGLQYTPNPQTLRRGSVGSYLARVNFRAGYKTRDMYLTYNGKQLSSNLFSFGLGLPYGNTKTTFNITYQYGRMGLKNSGLLDEEFHTIALGLSLYDIWFYKSKFD